jgi:hypothetical protein
MNRMVWEVAGSCLVSQQRPKANNVPRKKGGRFELRRFWSRNTSLRSLSLNLPRVIPLKEGFGRVLPRETEAWSRCPFAKGALQRILTMSPHEAATSDRVRVQIDFNRSKVEAIDRLATVCGLDTRKDLFNHALSLFEWAVKEVQSGREIGSLNRAEKDVTVVNMPALTNAAQSSENSNAHHNGPTASTGRKLALASR